MALLQSSSASLYLWHTAYLQQTMKKKKPPQANTWRSPLQLEVGHGSVGVQQDVQGVGLHSFAVTLNCCLIFAFLEISISLTTIGTVTESRFAPFMQLKLHFLCYDMTSESRMHEL